MNWKLSLSVCLFLWLIPFCALLPHSLFPPFSLVLTALPHSLRVCAFQSWYVLNIAFQDLLLPTCHLHKTSSVFSLLSTAFHLLNTPIAAKQNSKQTHGQRHPCGKGKRKRGGSKEYKGVTDLITPGRCIRRTKEVPSVGPVSSLLKCFSWFFYTLIFVLCFCLIFFFWHDESFSFTSCSLSCLSS